MNSIQEIRRRLAGLAGDRKGSVVTELAFLLPVALIIVVGCFDAARYVLLHQKIDRASSTMADLVAQPETFDPDNDIAALYPAATRLVEPFDLETNGLVILSQVTGEAGDIPRIIWQRDAGGSFASGSSEIGPEGSVATLPDAFDIVREGETMIVAEVFYDYEPLFLDYIYSGAVIMHDSYRRPRQR